MKTSELIDLPLAWAVAKCEGRDMYFKDGDGPWFRDAGTHKDGADTDYSDWALCGPIIEREKIGVVYFPDGWQAQNWQGQHNTQSGPTPLIAAMRCYVSSRLGDKVEIPEELK